MHQPDSDDDMDFVPEEEEDEGVPAKKQRPICKYGVNCYRKNKQHFIDFAHPHLEKTNSAPLKKQPSQNEKSLPKKASNMKIEPQKEDLSIAKNEMDVEKESNTAAQAPAKVVEKPPPAKIFSETVPPAKITSSQVPPAKIVSETVPPAKIVEKAPPAKIVTETEPANNVTVKALPGKIVSDQTTDKIAVETVQDEADDDADTEPDETLAQPVIDIAEEEQSQAKKLKMENSDEEKPQSFIEPKAFNSFIFGEKSVALSTIEDDKTVTLPENEVIISKSPQKRKKLTISEQYPFPSVLYVPEGDQPKIDLPKEYKDAWDGFHIRLPCSPSSTYKRPPPFEQRKLSRWYLIQSVFQQPVDSPLRLEQCIFTYNPKPEGMHFTALHQYFYSSTTRKEAENFFRKTLPFIIKLALRLPSLFPSPISLLFRKKSQTVKLTRIQCGCLLANAFLCTFPQQGTNATDKEMLNKKENVTDEDYYANKSVYPYFSFSRLFSVGGNSLVNSSTLLEKLKCFIHYFEAIMSPGFPEKEIVEFQRHFLPKLSLPQWEKSEIKICGESSFSVHGEGFIEDSNLKRSENLRAFADFANKSIGGGVLGRGAIQEEILFSVFPECVCSLLFTSVLSSTETLSIHGAVRYNLHNGYGNTFEFTGDNPDKFKHSTEIICFDALQFGLTEKEKLLQYEKSYLFRELNKAFIAFSNAKAKDIATGNWGCGAFGGIHDLKAVLQIVAAVQAKKSIAYYTFGTVGLGPVLEEFLDVVKEKRITVSMVVKTLLELSEQVLNGDDDEMPQLFNCLIDTFDQ